MAYDLVAIAGPVVGERFALSEDEVVIGRTRSGISLPDPLVSVKHATMKLVKGEWTLTDLDSATGTKLNGEPIASGQSMPVQLGDVITIGECELQLDSGATRVVRRLLWAMVPAWLLVLAAVAALFWVTGDRVVVVSTGQDIRTASGTVRNLVIPKPFIRQHGLNIRNLRLRRVTDFDEDEIDELWLYVGNDEIAVTFTDAGSWKLLGRVPQGCVDQRGGSGFPDLVCDGIDYRMLEGQYRAVAQLDPVVWFVGEAAGEYAVKVDEPKAKRKAKKKAKGEGEEGKGAKGPTQAVPELEALRGAKGPVPYRISMGNIDKLAGFLASQGITEPVHYIICEDALPGVPPQALLRGGIVQPLSFGCGEDVKLEGVRAPAFEGSKIAAVAFTAVGREMLPKHLAYTWSGAPDPLFVPGFYRNVVDSAASWPIPLKGGVYVGFESAGHVFHPIASEPVLNDRIRLQAEDATDIEAITATLLSSGLARLDPEGCAEIRLRTRPFRCSLVRGCLPGRSFIEAIETGCGEDRVIAQAGYATGATIGSTANVEVRIEVVTHSSLGVTDVIQARVGARPKR